MLRRKVKPSASESSSASSSFLDALKYTSCFCFLAGVIVLLNTNKANATASTITLSVSDSISLDIAALSVNGTFAHSSTSDTTISVTTSNASGYTLGIAASTANDNALKYIESGTTIATIPSITNAVSATDYADDNYAIANNLNNTWGFRPSKYNSVDNTVTNNYYPGPASTSAITLDATSTANPSTANNYNIAIGSRVNSSQAVGSYGNTFVITAVANAIPYTITYNQNTTDTVTDLPSNVSTTTYDETVTISSTIPVRDGYTFKGWCTNQTTDGQACTDVSGTTYNPDGAGTDLTWTLDHTSTTNALALYAMWESAGPCSESNNYLYCKVANLVKTYGGSPQTQTKAQLQATITTPTSSNPATDTSNSGVFLYDTTEFGASSDVDDGYDIYYYRGVLDSSFTDTSNKYGTTGNGGYYPNYVILDSDGTKTTADTCWRIVRTTASGGVKMIYNGKWTGSTCANGADNAQLGTNTFSVDSSKYYGSAFGYTQNSSYNSSNTSATYSTMFGSNTSFANNSTSSGIKSNIETWFSGSNGISAYESILEKSAGYCNDRTLYSSNTATSPILDSTTVSTSTTYYAGAYMRNATTTQSPSLTCPRNQADLYTVNASDVTTGNKQLSKPAALLTADEAAFAGSGNSSGTTPYHVNAFLRSGSSFWLLSPRSRSSSGYANELGLGPYGDLGNHNVYNSYGVRPAISLTSGTTVTSGAGTADNPWVITAP